MWAAIQNQRQSRKRPASGEFFFQRLTKTFAYNVDKIDRAAISFWINGFCFRFRFCPHGTHESALIITLDMHICRHWHGSALVTLCSLCRHVSRPIGTSRSPCVVLIVGAPECVRGGFFVPGAVSWHFPCCFSPFAWRSLAVCVCLGGRWPILSTTSSASLQIPPSGPVHTLCTDFVTWHDVL